MCKSTHLVFSVDAPWPYIVKTLITNAIFICATATMAFGQHVSHLNGPDWVQVTEQAPWQPRDSQGEIVHNQQLWILGGWFQSYEAPPRDV